MATHKSIIVLAIVCLAAVLQVGANATPVGSGCVASSCIHKMSDGLVRVRRQLVQQQQPQQPASDPLSFISNLGQQAEKIQSSAKMFSSLFSSGPTSPQQANAASQLQQAFQPQAAAQQSAQPSPATLMSQLSEMVRATQDRSMKLASDTTQNANQVAQAGQQQAQQAQGGIQSALTEIGQGLSKIAMNNPSLLPDIKNLYSSVSSKLSSASSSIPQPGAQSFPSQGPIVPAKNGDQLVDNLAKVSMGQTQ